MKFNRYIILFFIIVIVFFSFSKALDMHVAVVLLRLTEGLDCSAILNDIDDPKKSATMTIRGNQSFSQLSQGI